MNPDDASAVCSLGTPCITCSDQGIVMRVLAVGAGGLAVCIGDDERMDEVEIALVDGVGPGDLLLVHAGVAIAHLGVAKVTS